MPMIDADGCPIYVEVEGREGAPALMLSNSLGTNLHMWDEQTPEWAKHFRVIRYDRRGHGKSGVPKGPYSMERFGRDVLAVLDALKIKKTNWCGLSMGGMVGQRRAPTPPTASTSSFCRTPTTTTPTRRRGPTASNLCRRKVSPSWSIRTWSAGSPRNSAPARRRHWRA